jgi:hypothetical protein
VEQVGDHRNGQRCPAGHVEGLPAEKGDTVTVPAGLLVPKTYLIWSEVSYTYKPTIGYVMAKAGITLKNQSYTRPRQSDCVNYPALANCTPVP